MDHEAYETQMFEAVNQHGEDAAEIAAKVTQNKVVNRADARAVVIGLKRTFIALVTAALFALSVYSFIKVASAPGYCAVGLFFLAIIELVASFLLLYAQGLAPKLTKESKGENK